MNILKISIIISKTVTDIMHNQSLLIFKVKTSGVYINRK